MKRARSIVVTAILVALLFPATVQGKQPAYQDRASKGSPLAVKPASETCGHFTGISDIVVFPHQGVMVALLDSECRDNIHPANPCDCDGQYPVDEEGFRFCPTATSATVILRAGQSAKKTGQKTDGK